WTFEPRPGRPYEHVSLSGAETVGIVRFLMSLPDPDERVRRAILSALLWLEEAQLPDGRWARFYEIGTNRDRKSTRLNSSHVKISYAVFCLKKKKKIATQTST